MHHMRALYNKFAAQGKTQDQFDPGPFNRRFLAKLEQPDGFGIESLA
jgi:hypothetical protein